jgi:hypothetical protein
MTSSQSHSKPLPVISARIVCPASDARIRHWDLFFRHSCNPSSVNAVRHSHLSSYPSRSGQRILWAHLIELPLIKIPAPDSMSSFLFQIQQPRPYLWCFLPAHVHAGRWDCLFFSIASHSLMLLPVLSFQPQTAERERLRTTQEVLSFP